VEESTAKGDIPHILIGERKIAGEIIQEYGEPSFVGKFQLESGEVYDVYWFGPIFIMAEGLDGTYWEIGGWVSRLKE